VTTVRTVIAPGSHSHRCVLVSVALPATGVADWANSAVATLIGIVAGLPIGSLILQRLDSRSH
jgi:hypothetical protein